MTVVHYPMVSIDITNRCNLRCYHCRSYLDSFELGTDEMLAVIAEVNKLRPRIVVLSGGEPLMRRDLFTLIAAIHDGGSAVQLNTNGLTVDEQIVTRLVESGVEYLQVSLDGPELVHDSIRGPRTYRRAVAACRLVGDRPRLVINTTVSRYNLPYLEEMGEDLLDGVDRLPIYVWGLKRFVPFNVLKECRLALGPEGLAHLTYLWLRLRKRYPAVRIKTDIPQTNRLDRLRTWSLMERYQMGCAGCSAGVQCLTVRADGTVSPCPTLYITLGSLLDGGIESVLASPLLRSLCDRSGLHGECAVCADRTICGGCRALAHVIGGDVLGSDPECYLFAPKPSPELASRRSTVSPPLDLEPWKRRPRGGAEEQEVGV